MSPWKNTKLNTNNTCVVKSCFAKCNYSNYFFIVLKKSNFEKGTY